MSDKRPNLIYVFPDQFRQQSLGCMNADPVVTANLDRLAAEGRVLTDVLSTCPLCSPYRAMLFTGKYPHANGVPHNCNSENKQYGIELRADERCLMDVLHDAGYHQAYIGKWHLDAPTDADEKWGEGRREDGKVWDTFTPPERRHHVDFWHSYGCCDNHLRPHYWQGDRIEDRIDVDEWSVKHETDVALDYVRNEGGRFRDADKPFALFLAHNPPHTPFEQVPQRLLAAYEGKTSDDLLNRPNVALEGYARSAAKQVKNYFAAVTGIDEQMGRILDLLDEQGLADDTIVIFTADHGEMMGSHGLMHKNVWYEESFLVPFIIRWPGKVPVGRDDLLVSTPDLMRTLLGLVGAGDAAPKDVQGRDLSPALLGEDIERPRSGLYTFMKADDPAGGNRGVRTHRHTFAVCRNDDGTEETFLHDNREDPYQLKNIAPQRPEIVAELTSEMNRWLERTGDPWLRA